MSCRLNLIDAQSAVFFTLNSYIFVEAMVREERRCFPLPRCLSLLLSHCEMFSLNIYQRRLKLHTFCSNLSSHYPSVWYYTGWSLDRRFSPHELWRRNTWGDGSVHRYRSLRSILLPNCSAVIRSPNGIVRTTSQLAAPVVGLPLDLQLFCPKVRKRPAGIVYDCAPGRPGKSENWLFRFMGSRRRGTRNASLRSLFVCVCYWPFIIINIVAVESRDLLLPSSFVVTIGNIRRNNPDNSCLSSHIGPNVSPEDLRSRGILASMIQLWCWVISVLYNSDWNRIPSWIKQDGSGITMAYTQYQWLSGTLEGRIFCQILIVYSSSLCCVLLLLPLHVLSKTCHIRYLPLTLRQQYGEASIAKHYLVVFPSSCHHSKLKWKARPRICRLS